MATGQIGAILSAFLVIVIGAALLTTTADEQTRITQLNTVNNETIALVAGTAVPLANNQLATIGTVYNASNASRVLTAGQNYTVDMSAGTISAIGISGDFNVTTYTWREVGDSTSRTLVILVIVFLAIAILTGVLAALSPSFRELMGDVFRR